MSKNNTDFSGFFEQEFENFSNGVKRVNVLVSGATGVGKSSILNKIFGSDIAPFGTGRPVTKEMKKYEVESLPLNIFDSEGCEVGAENEYFLSLSQTLKSMETGAEPIHVAWYCVQASGHRVTDFDYSVIDTINQTGLPVFVLLTKSDLVSETEGASLKSVLTNKFPKLKVFEVSGTSTEEFFSQQVSALCKETANSLPEGLKISFIHSQVAALGLKEQEAQKIVDEHAEYAFALALNPIPLADAAGLMLNQAKMLNKIFYIFGISHLPGIGISSKAVAGLASMVVRKAGVMTVGYLAKFIPGAGSTVGAIINTGVATSYTKALGAAAIKACRATLESEFLNMLGRKTSIDSVAEVLAKYFGSKNSSENLR